MKYCTLVFYRSALSPSQEDGLIYSKVILIKKMKETSYETRSLLIDLLVYYKKFISTIFCLNSVNGL